MSFSIQWFGPWGASTAAPRAIQARKRRQTSKKVSRTLESQFQTPFSEPLRRIHGMKVVPLNDKIVVKRLEAEEKTAGGIVLPDTAKEKPKQGKILSLGDGKLLDNGKRASFQVKEGDRVLFTSYAGTEARLDGADYWI